MKYKILITGGHTTPAIALMEELEKRKMYSFVYFGRKYAFDQAKNIESYEYALIRKMNIPFYQSDSPRFPSFLSLQSLYFPFRFCRSLVKSIRIVRNEKPYCIVTFGGYVSAPMILVGKLMGIPVILHEQTMKPGRANLFLSRFSNYIGISWLSSKKLFSKSVQQRIWLTGNPLRKEIRNLVNLRNNQNNSKSLYPSYTGLQPVGLSKQFRGFSSTKGIYFTGGSTGAHRLNEVLYSLLPELLINYRIYHQSGDSHFHDYETFQKLKDTLPKHAKDNYHLYKYISEKELVKIFSNIDIIVGRSGANTTVEIALLGIPSILIPLPESAMNEQKIQAEMLRSSGSSIVIEQHNLTKEQLNSAIIKIYKQYDSYKNHAKKFSQTENITIHKTAHSRLAVIVESCVSGNSHLLSQNN